MRIILEQDKVQEYVEIKLTLKEIESLKDGKILVTERTSRFRNKILGICVRKDDHSID